MDDNEIYQGIIIILLIIIPIIIKITKKNNLFNKKHKKNEIIRDRNENLQKEFEEVINKDKEEEEVIVVKEKNNNILPYKRKYLLSKNELYFYKKLKPIAKEYGYIILAKIRLADLIELNDEVKKTESYKYFNKIKSKHIDFILCNPENLYVEYLIELDDNSHKQIDIIENDKFKDEVSKKCGYKLLRLKDAEQIKELIINKNTEIKVKTE